jgi:hypothetical protein
VPTSPSSALYVHQLQFNFSLHRHVLALPQYPFHPFAQSFDIYVVAKPQEDLEVLVRQNSSSGLPAHSKHRLNLLPSSYHVGRCRVLRASGISGMFPDSFVDLTECELFSTWFTMFQAEDKGFFLCEGTHRLLGGQFKTFHTFRQNFTPPCAVWSNLPMSTIQRVLSLLSRPRGSVGHFDIFPVTSGISGMFPHPSKSLHCRSLQASAC